MVASPFKLCNLPAQTLPSGRVLNESSGIVDSRLHPNVFWTHNDSGGTWVYAIGYDGTHRKSVRLIGPNVSGGDWEDIAYHAPTNVMWVADCGNNSHTKDIFRAYRFSEPSVLGTESITLDVPATPFVFKFGDAPSGGWNCECMLVDPDGRVYFVNKESARRTKLYAAQEILSEYPAVNVLTPLANWPAQGSITGGDWASDDSAIVISSANLKGFEYDPVTFALRRQFPLPEAFKSDTSTTSQEEALAFTRDGNNLIRGSEGRGSQVWWVPFRETIPSLTINTQDESGIRDTGEVFHVLGQEGVYVDIYEEMY